MLNFKKLGSLALAGCMALSTMMVSASAIDSPDSNISGGQLQAGEQIVSNAEQIDLIQSDESLSNKEKQEMISKLEDKPQSRATYRACNLSVPQIMQETSYYCGPASAMQVLKYYYDNFGSSSMYSISLPRNQNALASVIGTTTDGSTGSGVAKGLNAYQNRTSYITKQIGSQSSFKDDINSSLTVGLSPIILRSKLSASSGFGYNSAGHFVTLSGQTSGLSKVLIVDPYYGFSSVKGPSGAQYYVSIGDAYSSITSHPAQQYIY